MVEESVEVPVRRETRSYFWLLREVRVKVSSKRVASAMVAGGCGVVVGDVVVVVVEECWLERVGDKFFWFARSLSL
jgi:hypothetical protein